MKWEQELKKTYYSDNAEIFIQGLKGAVMIAMNNFKEFETFTPESKSDKETQDKLKDIGLSISQLGDAVIAFEKLLKLQEEMQ